MRGTFRHRIHISYNIDSCIAYPAADLAADLDDDSIASSEPVLKDTKNANLSDASIVTDADEPRVDEDAISNFDSAHDSDHSIRDLISSNTKATRGKLQQRLDKEV